MSESVDLQQLIEAFDAEKARRAMTDPVTIDLNHEEALTRRLEAHAARLTRDTPILDEAAKLVRGPRASTYDPPSVNFQRIAQLWSVILGVDVTPEQHALCMIAVKIARLVASPTHHDSVVDIAGYAQTLGDLLATRTPESA